MKNLPQSSNEKLEFSCGERKYLLKKKKGGSHRISRWMNDGKWSKERHKGKAEITTIH